MNEIAKLAALAREASFPLAAAGSSQRNEALLAIVSGLEAEKARIFEANQADIKKAEKQNLPPQLIHRLLFDEKKLRDVISGLHDLASLPDPLGRTLRLTELADGMTLRCISTPIGVVGVIFESRPDALVQIASLCLKSGNAVLLKGGVEARGTNQVLFEIIEQQSRQCFLPDGWIALLKSREDVSEMLKADENIDLIIPRGSNAFVKYIMDNTRIPVLGHSSGICHVYLDATADPDMAARIAVDSKTQYPAACNAAETLLVHMRAIPALRRSAEALHAAGVVLHADERIRALLTPAGIPCKPLSEADYSVEYGDLEMNLHMVDSLEEAISHINRYGSHHTDSIVTASQENANRFAALVDSAGVYHNCSTRFADGYRYGFGAEVGISTGKIHARGPMGLDGLCSYKYLIEGSGDCVADFAEGRRTFTHIPRM